MPNDLSFLLCLLYCNIYQQLLDDILKCGAAHPNAMSHHHYYAVEGQRMAYHINQKAKGKNQSHPKK